MNGIKTLEYGSKLSYNITSLFYHYCNTKITLFISYLMRLLIQAYTHNNWHPKYKYWLFLKIDILNKFLRFISFNKISDLWLRD